MKVSTIRIKNGIDKVAEFLDELELINKPSYRKTIKKSDEEIAEFIENQKINILCCMRDYITLLDFIKKEKLTDKFMLFQASIQKEFEEVMNDGHTGQEN